MHRLSYLLPSAALWLMAGLGPVSAGTVTFDRTGTGYFPRLAFDNGDFGSGPDQLDGIWLEDGFAVNFTGHPALFLPLDYSLNSAFYDKLRMSDCRGCFFDFPSFDTLSIRRADNRSFSLDRIDIGSSYSSHLLILYTPDAPKNGCRSCIPTCNSSPPSPTAARRPSGFPASAMSMAKDSAAEWEVPPTAATPST